MTEEFVFKPNGPKPYHTGLAVPVFSLRSKNSWGIGQFTDLKLLADFAAKSAMDVIQLLPINDTTIFMNWKDTSPYRANSVFALHPIYLDFSEFLPKLSQGDAEKFVKEAEELNALEQIDYERTLDFKWRFVQLVFDQFHEKIFLSSEFKAFYQAGKFWLKPYAAFCYFRDKYKTADFEQWKEKLYSESLFMALSKEKEASEKINLHIFVQYLLHCQLKEAIDYCHHLGIAVKGDISVGVDRKSADAWACPELFNLDMQAGAPPDVFSVTGQNWEFPTYDWSKMAEDGFAWWKLRMRNMAEYFDAYRLDHILGFFRIWENPGDAVRGLLGHFSPALPLSADEIESYGIPLRYWGVERFTEPFIKDWVIDEIFGRDNRDNIIQRFLDYEGNGNYRLKAAYNTQQKVNLNNQIESWQKEGLYQLHENIIFIRDHNNPNMFHPRINMMNTISFREFGDAFKYQLEVLHHQYFYGRNYNYWQDTGLKRLTMIKNATDMLACGEDLGMVPDTVPDVMRQLQILRLIVERMPEGNSFVTDLSHVPYLSVITASSHDTTPLRLWWQEDHNLIQRYYNEIMHWEGEAPWEANPEIIQEIIKRMLNTDAMLAIFPIQDWLDLTQDYRAPDAELTRINNPAFTYYYWRYRMHWNLESLASSGDLTGFLADFIKDSKRSETRDES
ncbi:MAG: 4-alpha-glucanotransferase [Streptococcaceae bacterium]|jgi:4-alpha-glucanotransferase|nr:4-alpha-glucanotransferase [Streptococcaceae bacterium]